MPIQLKFNFVLFPLLLLFLSACKDMQPMVEKVEPAVEKVKPLIEKVKQIQLPEKQTASTKITTQQMVDAIKQALNQGVDDSIYLLGSLEGFNLSERYHINLPDQLEKPAALLRKLGQGKKVDEFETRLNRAAKQAVKQATPIFSRAIKQMTVKDALAIMKGQDDAATLYFRSKTETSLRQRFLPVIESATDQTGLTSAYKSLNKTINTLSPSLSGYTVDIDRYVLDHAMDALFDRIAIEEKLIREQPLKRSTDLMKTVFGYFEKK